MQPSPRRRRGLALAVVVAVLPVLSGCASGFDSPVLQDYNPAVGITVRGDREVYGMNLLVVLPESGPGTLVGNVLNKAPAGDRLLGASLASEEGEVPVRTTLLRPSLPLPPERLVDLSEPPTLAVESDIMPGRFVRLTLEFQRAEPMVVKIPVVATEGPYADVPLPQESPATPTAASTPTGTPTGTPTAEATPTPTPTPSPSPTG